MSLDKSIQSGKDHRKPYTNSKQFDRTCRNHGACPYCEGNRTHSNKKRAKFARQQISEWTSDTKEI